MKPMVENSKLYKEMILHTMDTLNALSNSKIDLADPIKYKNIFQHMILISTSCLDNVEYRVYPVYHVLQRHISPIVMTNDIPNNKNSETIQFYTDMRYSNDENNYDRVSYGINFVQLKNNGVVIISPYLDIIYMNIRSRLALESHRIYTKDSIKYTFYKLYDTIFTSTEKLMLEEYKDIYDNIKNMDTSSKNIRDIIEEMAILTTLTYMKYIVPKDNYNKFMEMEDDVDNTRAIYEINKSLYSIGTKDPKLLDDTISKIRDIISKVNK